MDEEEDVLAGYYVTNGMYYPRPPKDQRKGGPTKAQIKAAKEGLKKIMEDK